MSLLLFGALLAAPTALAKPSKTEIAPGEPFVVEVIASGPPSTQWTFPGDTTTYSLDLRKGPSREGTQEYIAAAFVLGDTVLPPFKVGYKLPDGTSGEVATAPVTLKVLATLPKELPPPADLRPPLPLSIGRAFYVAAGAAVLLGVLAAVLVSRWRLRRDEGPPALQVSPDVEALRSLDRLASAGHLEKGDLRGFYIGLTLVTKTYLEKRLAAPIAEMTSVEMVGFLREHPAVSEFAPLLRTLSGAADGIKFARADALRSEAEAHLGAVRGLIPAVEARLQRKEVA